MTPFKRGILASTIFVLLCFLVWFKWGSSVSPEKLPTPVDALDRLEATGAPDFELSNFDEKKIRLSKYKGKVIILNFWATWCAPCVTEFPSMLRMAGMLRDKVVLITVAADERKEDVLAFIDTFKGKGSNIVHLWDPTTSVARQFGTEKLPETYILGRELKLAKKVASSLEWDKPEVLEFLRNL